MLSGCCSRSSHGKKCYIMSWRSHLKALTPCTLGSHLVGHMQAGVPSQEHPCLTALMPTGMRAHDIYLRSQSTTGMPIRSSMHSRRSHLAKISGTYFQTPPTHRSRVLVKTCDTSLIIGLRMYKRIFLVAGLLHTNFNKQRIFLVTGLRGRLWRSWVKVLTPK